MSSREANDYLSPLPRLHRAARISQRHAGQAKRELHVAALLVAVAVMALTGCAPQPAATEEPGATRQIPTLTATPTSTVSPTIRPTATPTTPPTPSATPIPTPSPTPPPFSAFTIDGLRSRSYPGGTVEIIDQLAATNAYTRYLIAYPSQDPSPLPSARAAQPLTITGIMQVPRGEGPFPVVILNHGYIPPSQYVSGSDTWRPADHLARNGFLTLAPDFRGWAGSTSGSNYFRTGLVIDALNLISSLDSIPQADTRYIGMWGHSMGGGVTLTSLVVDSRIDAGVLYAPVSGDFADNYEKWGDANSEAMGGGDTLRDLYAEAVEDASYVRQVSPINYLNHIQAPVQIHQGTVDVTTPSEWAEAIAEGLSAAEKDIEYFAYEGQNHAFQGAAWRLFLDRITAFYDAELRE